MDELIARLEAASEGDTGLRVIGGLDDQIWRLVNDKQWLFKGWQYDLKEAPHYTTSIDAALTLVPEGWVWKVSNGYSVKCSAELAKPVNTEFGAAIAVRSQIFGQATPALALCIAALRARSHTAAQEK